MIIFMLWMGCTPKKQSTSTCTNLDSSLQSVAMAADPISLAQEKGLMANDTQVRVMITLKEGESPFWGGSITTELSIQQRHQVLLAPQKLCSISSDERVLSVIAPKRPSPKKR